jgi:hypothetical protein
MIVADDIDRFGSIVELCTGYIAWMEDVADFEWQLEVLSIVH